MDLSKSFIEQSEETRAKFKEEMDRLGVTHGLGTREEVAEAIQVLAARRLLERLDFDWLAATLFYENATGKRCPYRTKKDWMDACRRCMEFSERFDYDVTDEERKAFFRPPGAESIYTSAPLNSPKTGEE